MPHSSILFLDTSYIYAIINSNDQWHQKAMEHQVRINRDETLLLTTKLILIEIADGLSAPRFREAAIRSIEVLTNNPLVEVVDLNSDLYQRGFALYTNRLDKGWGLTDCISFLAMSDRGLNDALTADDHFRQAGFNALLLSS